MKKIFLTLLFGIFFIGNTQLFAQELSPERKQAVDSLALEKVRDLSKYIKIVGSKETPWSEANRVIDRAEELSLQKQKSAYHHYQQTKSCIIKCVNILKD